MNDIGDYCRQVEAHLTRVNGGHLVRIVGPGFMLVRQWAEEGVPISAVFRGIEQKAERHKAGAARRPLRIEFCESDVREVYEAWRRAIGVGATALTVTDASTEETPADRGSGSARRVTTRDLDRAIERLMSAAGRLELPELFRDEINRALEQVMAVRDAVKGSRGAARDTHLARLPGIDVALMAAAHTAMTPEALAPIQQDAERDLEPFRGRLSPEAWAQAIAVTMDRGVRGHFGLPEIAGIE